MVEKQWWYRDTAGGVTQGPLLAKWSKWVKGRFLSTITRFGRRQKILEAMQQTAPFQSAFRAAAAAAERKIRESQVVVPDRTERNKPPHPSIRECRCKIESALLKRDRLQEPPAVEKRRRRV
jgi:hypothetical protein